jgi:hypothetical protein
MRGRVLILLRAVQSSLSRDSKGSGGLAGRGMKLCI